MLFVQRERETYHLKNVSEFSHSSTFATLDNDDDNSTGERRRKSILLFVIPRNDDFLRRRESRRRRQKVDTTMTDGRGDEMAFDLIEDEKKLGRPAFVTMTINRRNEIDSTYFSLIRFTSLRLRCGVG